MGGRGAGGSGGGRGGGGGISGERSEFNKMGRDLDRNYETTKNLPLSDVGRLGREAYQNISGGRAQQYNALKDYAQRSGWTVIERSMPRGNGVANYSSRTITINSNSNLAQKTRTLVHEITHTKLHSGNSNKSRAQKEIEAEMTAKMVIDEMGTIRGNNNYSNNYINGWQRQGNISRSELSSYERDVMRAYDGIMDGFDF